MKFWDRVLTVYGPGNVLAAMADGLALVAIRRADVQGGLVCTGPCINVAARVIGEKQDFYHETHETHERGER